MKIHYQVNLLSLLMDVRVWLWKGHTFGGLMNHDHR